MAKQPYIPLYIGDWEKDTNCLTNLAEFALLKLTFKLFNAEKRGVFEANFRSLSVLFKTDLATTKDILNELLEEKILEISEIEDGKFCIKSRRMLRETEISETRAANGKKGGESKTKAKRKQTISKSEAKSEQNTDIDNESDIDNVDEVLPEKKEYVRDVFFETALLKFFGFTEMPFHNQQQKLLLACCQAQFFRDQFDFFKKQCIDYKNYIDLIGVRYKKNFNDFLGQQSECFQDGFWKTENWEQKIIDRQRQSSNGRGATAVIESSLIPVQRIKK